MADDAPSSRRPLGRLPRTLIAVLLVLGVTVPSLLIRELIKAKVGNGPLADLGGIAVPVATTAWLAPGASYRRRDALLWLVGPGIFIFAVIAWRLAFLPYRDWTPRPDEASRVRWLRDPQHAGMWYVPGEAK
ncbi:hypothetical protein [Micromonospora sp. NBC_01638]|uniref:hypothetical protein n=1 Tax=Micromonospora sp. NBC_01638 TaxID=2975982 RepID=UPI00386A87E3|nr:hypothetical protein OG811_11680 [Micromonospora sp. NBC_01638]